MKNILNKPPKRPLKIYIVDDEEYYLKLIQINLKKLGFDDIKTFSNGEQCLLEIIQNKPDCVILDYIIKNGNNGDEILKKIKFDYPEINVIILSGQDDINIATNIIRQGATDYVVKNQLSFFNIGNTLNKISKIINSNELNSWKSRRIKLLYILLLLLVWGIGVFMFYVKIKSGVFL